MNEEEIEKKTLEILSMDASVKEKRLAFNDLFRVLSEQEKHLVFGNPLITKWVDENEVELAEIIRGQIGGADETADTTDLHLTRDEFVARMLEEKDGLFGHAIKISTGRMIPVRWVGEQHVKEDCGFIPTIQDWFCNIRLQKWMGEPPAKLEEELAE